MGWELLNTFILMPDFEVAEVEPVVIFLFILEKQWRIHTRKIVDALLVLRSYKQSG